VLAYQPAWLALALPAAFTSAPAPALDRLSLATFVNTVPPRAGSADREVHAHARMVWMYQYLLAVDMPSDDGGSVRLVGPPKHPVRYQQYRTALHEHIMRRFLTLVVLLDRAKTAQLLPAEPLLFTKASGGATLLSDHGCCVLLTDRRPNIDECVEEHARSARGVCADAPQRRGRSGPPPDVHGLSRQRDTDPPRRGTTHARVAYDASPKQAADGVRALA
jgi:hypothetical protein